MNGSVVSLSADNSILHRLSFIHSLPFREPPFLSQSLHVHSIPCCAPFDWRDIELLAGVRTKPTVPLCELTATRSDQGMDYSCVHLHVPVISSQISYECGDVRESMSSVFACRSCDGAESRGLPADFLGLLLVL